MKKILFISISLLLLLVGCSNANETDNNKENNNLNTTEVNEDKDKNNKEETNEVKTSNIDYEYINSWLEDNKEYLDKQPTLGDKDAPVTIVEIGDYRCSYCAKWNNDMLPEIKEKLVDTGKAKVVYVNLPFLSEDSNLAAYAVEAVYHQNEEAFWEYQDLVYQIQQKDSDKDTTEFLLELAKEVNGIDIKQLEKDLEEETYKLDVQDDKLFAQMHGVTGTPTIVINGYTINQSFDINVINGFITEYEKNKK